MTSISLEKKLFDEITEIRQKIYILREQIEELRKIEKEKCIELFKTARICSNCYFNGKFKPVHNERMNCESCSDEMRG